MEAIKQVDSIEVRLQEIGESFLKGDIKYDQAVLLASNVCLDNKMLYRFINALGDCNGCDENNVHHLPIDELQKRAVLAEIALEEGEMTLSDYEAEMFQLDRLAQEA